MFLGYQYTACGIIASEVQTMGGTIAFCCCFFCVTKRCFLCWPNLECPGDNFGGNFGAILVIWAVRAPIWTPRGPRYQKRAESTPRRWQKGRPWRACFRPF